MRSVRIRTCRFCVVFFSTMALAPAQTHEVLLHSFAAPPPYGAVPTAGVTRDAAGNLYGTTEMGGAFNQGVVFKLDSAGYLTVLHSFAGGADGANPGGTLALDSAGNVYGTTQSGGPVGLGILYKVDPFGNETVLYSFGVIEGSLTGPNGGVTLDSAGNIYGVTFSGGPDGYGVAYKLDTSGNLAVLHNFFGGADRKNGGSPNAPLVFDKAGNLYGTTSLGGTNNNGTVYKIDRSGNFTVLHSFSQTSGSPRAGVTIGPHGDLYGTIGDIAGPCGAVYKLGRSHRETTVYEFKGGADGCNPLGGVVFDSAGNLYGATYSGGASNAGTVYKVTPSGQDTVLYSFDAAAGFGMTYGTGIGFPFTGVALDPAGNLYGITPLGGSSSLGTVFQLTPSGWQNVLYNFSGYADGSAPAAALTSDSQGNLYGATSSGGAANSGIVFKVAPGGAETILHTFAPGSGDGANPVAGVTLDAAGNLYGTASSGGAAGKGMVYKLSPSGKETILYSFAGSIQADPKGGLVLDSAGNLYGTAFGSENGGCVYKLDISGNFTMLHAFMGGNDGSGPAAGVLFGPDGYLYGTTEGGGAGLHGVVFKMDTSGNETVLYNFTGVNGAKPVAGVAFDSAGNLYGTALEGGSRGYGIVYKLDPSGNETILHNFTGRADGGNPVGGVTVDPSGDVYGTASVGGRYGLGVAFKLTPTGEQRVLHDFQGGTDGASPQAGVILGSRGDLYGTTAAGTETSGGVLFELKP